MKKKARRDKRVYVEEMASQAEEVARQGHQSELYKITKQVCGNFRNSSSMSPVMDKNGKLLTTKEELEKR